MVDLPNIMIIGLTGMSGAGKSTMSMLFGLNGFHIINCDRIAYQTAKNPVFLEELQSRFPERLLNDDGTLDRAATAALIFSDKPKLELYDRVIFPYIGYEVMRQIKEAKGDVVLDAPTLFESGLDMLCTEIVGVIADIDNCVERITERDGISPESARARLSSQNDGEFFRQQCGIIIENNGDYLDFHDNAEKLIKQMKGTL